MKWLCYWNFSRIVELGSSVKRFDREDRWKGGDVREWRSPQEHFIAEGFAWFVERVAGK